MFLLYCMLYKVPTMNFIFIAIYSSIMSQFQTFGGLGLYVRLFQLLSDKGGENFPGLSLEAKLVKIAKVLRSNRGFYFRH